MAELDDALEQLYRDRYAQFWNALAALMHDDQLASDVLQEAFVRALRFQGTFRGDGALAGWVWRIALRTAYEHRRPRSEVPLEDWLDPTLPEPERDPGLVAKKHDGALSRWEPPQCRVAVQADRARDEGELLAERVVAVGLPRNAKNAGLEAPRPKES